MTAKLTKASFEPFLDTEFEIVIGNDGSLPIRLIEVTEKHTAAIESYTLLFRGPKDRYIRHDTHPVHHPEMGELNLFIGPVMYPKQDGIYYEVILSYLRRS
ncbi:MAG: hypothetical protein ABIA75_13890 [Candidatus Neomarinimicrobiota bacterium]